MMKTLNLNKEYAECLYKIFDNYCPKAEIWAYGSRLNGDSHAGSDLDLTVIDFNESGKDLCILKQLINDSNIPILVDISMFNALPHSFQNEITKGYVIFYKREM